jgi:hypothetical protein
MHRHRNDEGARYLLIYHLVPPPFEVQKTENDRSFIDIVRKHVFRCKTIFKLV